MAACGVPPGLFQSNATASRENYRQFLFSTVSPLGKLVSAELTRKLETEVNLDWHELQAADLQGRARSFKSMVDGGKDVGEAAALSGLLLDSA